MTPVRRIAAAALVGALGFGFVGIGAGPASALDTTWGLKTTGNQSLDTTWGEKVKGPKGVDTTWGEKTKSPTKAPTLYDTTWGTRTKYFR